VFRWGISTGMGFPVRETEFLKRNAAFQCRIYTGMYFLLCDLAECAFRTVIAAFRSVNMARKAASFQKSGTSFTTMDRVFKHL